MEQRLVNEGGPTSPHAELPGSGLMQRPTPDGAEPELRESELSTTLRMQKKTHAVPFWIGAAAVFLFSLLVLGGWKAVAKRERRPVGPPVPTDPEGLKGTLDALEKAAERVRAKWTLSSEDVRAAFSSYYSPRNVASPREVDPRTIPGTVGLLVDTYVKALKSGPFPDKNASKEEKEEYALSNMLLSAVLDAVYTRLDQLTSMESFAAGNPGIEVVHLGVRTPLLWMCDLEKEEDTVSFAKFSRDLQAAGIVQLPPQNGEGPTAPEAQVERLKGYVKLNNLISSYDQKVLGIFQELLGFVAQAKFGRDSDGKERIDNLYISPSSPPFPFTRFAQAVDRSSKRTEVRRVSPSNVLGWKDHWNMPGLQAQIFRERTKVVGSVYLQQEERRDAVSGWLKRHEHLTRLSHPFTIAVSLL
ncbi:hypothetical protein, conserved [Eimeria acervulina]|uniref:Transmembrane protein n=1 Tax=Eimeria acervulina TaxID=5801 RepID=U6GXR9_EIMAC|nr:hypothetical protein, conserved [Eimeria acervulina]CDI83344.1 hypothetical protein, conserved [Eimeria acervulina]